jgi:hypothetical protein
VSSKYENICKNITSVYEKSFVIFRIRMIAVLGCGVAGTLVVLELLAQNVSPNSICAIDPFFDGGALGRQWGDILSNTQWQQITNALQNYTSCRQFIEEYNQRYQPDQTVPLSELSNLLRKSLNSLLDKMTVYVQTAKQVQQTPNKGWKITLSSGSTLECDILILCQGGEAKTLDFGKPSIPLEIALNKSKLGQYVKSGDSVCLFGTAHSGTLILNNLLSLQGVKTFAFYKTPKPFLFARDGYYDGIKEESAEIATRLLENPTKQIELIPYEKIQSLVKCVSKSTWIISATGFQPRMISILNEEGQAITSERYEAGTGKIAENLYGFGLAYPGLTELNGTVFKDVSIPAFVEQIKRCLPAIKNQE